MASISTSTFISVLCVSVAAISSAGNRVLSNAMQAANAKPFPVPNGTIPENGKTSGLELVGTILACPGQTHTMSWSPDGRYLATSIGEKVSLWLLPEKSPVGDQPNHQRHANKDIDVRSTVSEDENITKVRKRAWVWASGTCCREFCGGLVFDFAWHMSNVTVPGRIFFGPAGWQLWDVLRIMPSSTGS